MTNNFVVILLILSFRTGFGQNPRHPGEWEEISGIIMEFRYFKHPNISWDEALDPFIKTAKACVDENVNFYILEPTQKSIYNGQIDLDSLFKAKNILSPLIHIIPIDSIDNTFPWVRDHGLNFVYDKKFEKPHLYNFLNDQTGRFIADKLDLNTSTISTKLDSIKYYTDGGNFLTDGHGTFNITVTDLSEDIPTELIEKDDYFYKNLGIEKTLNIRAPFVHIDYFLKMIDEETAVISYIPNENYDISLDNYYDHQYYIDQAAIAIKQNLLSVYDREINLIPIQNAPSTYSTKTKTVLHTAQATYTNALILNHTVLVPQYQIKLFDSAALNTYKKIMPGYKIIGVNCRQYGELSGAIHCMTHEIYSKNSIYIKHKWYKDEVMFNPDGYPVDIVITSTDKIKKITLNWKTKSDLKFVHQDLKPISNNKYKTFIPPNKIGDKISYYLSIETTNNKTYFKPKMGPIKTYSFDIR